MAEFGRFFLPGPTEVRPEVLETLARPVIGHRGRSMEQLMARLQPPLRRLFGTERPVYVATSSATGLMEAAIRNCVQRRVLCLVCGAFSERFHRIAVACGRTADRLDVEWGDSNEPGQVAEALQDGEYDAVTLVHSETSTGVLNPVAEIAATVHDVSPETLVIVDCVSSLAATPVEVDGWGLDFALAGTQKAVAIPPGLALGVASARALERARNARDAGVYFSFEAFDSALAKNQPPNTPAVSLLYALAAQLERIGTHGLSARWAAHREMADRTADWMRSMNERYGLGLEILAREGRRSPSVTCALLPSGIGGAAVVGAMAEKGYTIGSGYGRLKDRAFRIGHMGDHTLAELESLLDSLEETLRNLGENKYETIG